MKSKEVELTLVIQLLEQKRQTSLDEIQETGGANQQTILLKTQLTKAIDCLKMCQEFQLSKGEIPLLSIPEGGSKAYLTSFYLVDEAEIHKVDEWAIKKLDGKPIELSCFDILGKRH